MHIFSFRHFLQSHKQDILRSIVATFVVGIAALLILAFVVTRKYTSEVQILVIQKYTLTDSYTASKSAEKVSKNLAEVIKTSVFLNDVLATKKVDLSDLTSLSEEEKRKEWSKKLSTQVDSSAAILKITAFDPDRLRAEAIVTTVAQVLIDKGGEYHGAPDTISLKIVDTALTSEAPESPSIPLYTAAAMLSMLFVCVLFYVLKETGTWLEPVSVVPTTLARAPEPVIPQAQQAPKPVQVARPAAVPTPATATVPTNTQQLNVGNFSEKLNAHNPKEKEQYLRGDMKTMHDNTKTTKS